MYAAALLEVVEAQAHQIRLEAVMDAIGKIELDNYRERSTLRKRGTAKQGRACTPAASPTDTALETIDDQAEVVRRTFQMYVDEGMGSYSIAVLPTDEGITTQTGKLLWLQSRFHHILGNALTRAPGSTATTDTSPPRTESRSTTSRGTSGLRFRCRIEPLRVVSAFADSGAHLRVPGSP